MIIEVKLLGEEKVIHLSTYIKREAELNYSIKNGEVCSFVSVFERWDVASDSCIYGKSNDRMRNINCKYIVWFEIVKQD